MAKLTIGLQIVNVDIEGMSKDLHKLHVSDDKKALALKFGMLDARVMEEWDEAFAETLNEQFTQEIREAFKPRIDDFVNESKQEVIKGLYSLSKMVV